MCAQSHLENSETIWTEILKNDIGENERFQKISFQNKKEKKKKRNREVSLQAIDQWYRYQVRLNY